MKITVEQGSFGYAKEQPLLDRIDLEVSCGEVLTILGPNGAGKTTLLRCIMGLLPWREGRTLLDGTPLNRFREQEIWQKIGYVPQSSGSRFAYTVLDMVLLGRAPYLRAYAQPGRKDYEIALGALERMGIGHLAACPCTRLSGGEYQLVTIARALAGQPEVLILDEPESHLDFRNQILVLEALESVIREDGISCILNTHYPEHALRLGGNTLLLGRQLPPLIGPGEQVITEENLSRYFGLDVAVSRTQIRGRTYHSVIPLSTREEQSP